MSLVLAAQLLLHNIYLFEQVKYCPLALGRKYFNKHKSMIA